MDIKIGSVGSSTGMVPQAAKSAERATSHELAKSFGEMLSKALGDVNDKLNEASELNRKLATGEVADLHNVMIASQKAEIALQFTVQVRNLLIQAYNELNRLR
jgi:flagellar hook-basal body complex protein FliE